MNMLATIVPKSDQINADDLLGRTMTITVNAVKFSGGSEQPVSLYFDGSDKAFRPCKSMCRVLVAVWGPDAKLYEGRSMTLYRDADVKFGGLAVGGIRISHMSHIDAPLMVALTATKGVKKAFTVRPLVVEQSANKPAEMTREDAELALRTTETLEGLQLVWKRKTMAPHREALQSVLDERKAALAVVVEDDDLATRIAETYIAKLAAADNAGVALIETDLERNRPDLGEDNAARVDAAIRDARARLKGGAK